MEYFKDAKVGERVYDLVYGEGKIAGNWGNAVVVEFPTVISKSILCSISSMVFNMDGRYNDEPNQRLFYTQPIVITQEDLGFGGNNTSSPDWYKLSECKVEFGIDACLEDCKQMQPHSHTCVHDFKDKYTRKVHRETNVKDLEQRVTDIERRLTEI